ncbi:MAG: thiamine biosynthesis lipoprotein [Bacteroidia bacterium]|jgi:thiamine biosynthesis lipoprotein
MQRIEHSFKAMGGLCRFRLEVAQHFPVQDALDAAETEVQRLEAKYSRYLEDSLTSRINNSAGSGDPIPIDTETAGLLHYAETAWRESDGLFDLTSGVLRRVWDFKSGTPPHPDAVTRLLPRVGWDKVQWSRDSISLPHQEMELDFGGCVKEYAADSAAMQLSRCGVTAALVDLAGDMVAVGVPAGAEGWPIGIRHPGLSGEAVARVQLPAGALASSGDYERCITLDGVRYGHILHPRTGWPVRGLVAVSVLAPQCLVAGSSATIAMLKPVAQGLEWLRCLGLPWIAVDADLQVHGTLSRD